MSQTPSGEDVYQQCLSTDDPNLCVTEQTFDELNNNREFTRQVGIILCAAMVFFMQAGFAMLCAGCVRTKNVQNTMLKNLLDAVSSFRFQQYNVSC